MTERASKCATKALPPPIAPVSMVADSSFKTASVTLCPRNAVDATDPPSAVAERITCAGHSSNGDDSTNILGNERSASAPAFEEEGGKEQKKKIRRRRGHGRRKWKPYHKLTTEEKRELEVREEHRAEKSRAERFAHGQPMAPYNTTQFLLNDREERTTGTNADGDVDALIDIAQRARAPSGSDAGNTSETGSGGGAGGSHSDSEFERDFEAEYDNANVERLDTLSRADLIREYLSLERELESVMSENRELRRDNNALRAAQTPLLTDTAAALPV